MYENLVLYAFHIKGCVIQRQKLRFQYQYHQVLFVNKVISHRKETPIGSDGKNLHLFLPSQCWCLKEGSKADVQFQNYVRSALVSDLSGYVLIEGSQFNVRLFLESL